MFDCVRGSGFGGGVRGKNLQASLTDNKRELLRKVRMLLPLKVILLDMDGVLAEVGRSYRTSIVETCRHFVGDGCTITPETVHQEKVKGGCNNDWVLSLCLIKRELGESGSASGAVQVPSLQEVTDKFEELYQGTGDVKGLYELETLIPERKGE